MALVLASLLSFVVLFLTKLSVVASVLVVLRLTGWLASASLRAAVLVF